MIQATAMRYRAADVAKEIDGTSRELRHFATKAEIDDPDFMAEFNSLVSNCDGCGRWSFSGENCCECD